MIRFNPVYLVWATVLLLVEIGIALFVHDAIIRPYIGDVLVVILMYCAVKAFLNTAVLPTAIGVLLFAFTIEVLQYLNVVKLLGLQHSSFAKTVIGTSFEWIDIAAYIAGTGLVLIAEKYWHKVKLL
jgi:Protein of unknown function (DUF2809)